MLVDVAHRISLVVSWTTSNYFLEHIFSWCLPLANASCHFCSNPLVLFTTEAR